jgi:hypothetical protein
MSKLVVICSCVSSFSYYTMRTNVWPLTLVRIINAVALATKWWQPVYFLTMTF